MLELQSYECLSRPELDRLVDELRDETLAWVQVSRSEFALGSSSYLVANPATYCEMACQTNPSLLTRFAWLYERLLAVLTPALRQVRNVPVTYAEGFARPGFVRLHSAVERER